MDSNNVRKVRETKMLSKTELARHGGISPLTLDRIEKRCPPRSLLAENSFRRNLETLFSPRLKVSVPKFGELAVLALSQSS